jgi:hypothetical protein
VVTTFGRELLARADATGDFKGVSWRPLFGAVSLAGRTLIGVQRLNNITNEAEAQWVVLDVSDYATDNIWRVVAAGAAHGMVGKVPGSAYADDDSLSFCVHEGRSFGVDGVEDWGTVRIRLTPQAVQGANLGGNLYM